jgi:hypothetical protein
MKISLWGHFSRIFKSQNRGRLISAMDDNNFFMINFHQGDHCLMTQWIGFNMDNPTAF